MKKHILLGTALASLFVLGACDYNEDNFPGFDEQLTITDVRTDTLVLADADYGKIAGMEENQGLALSKDPEGETYLTALEQLGKTKVFTDMVAPEDYLPAYVNSVFPFLSDGSKVLVQYNVGKEQPEYLSKLNSTGTFDLTSKDYKTVWGESMVVKYLTPATLKKVPALLKEQVKSPKEGDVCQVNYAWSETEPSTGGGSGDEPVAPDYTPISEVLAQKTGNFISKGEVVGASATSLLISDGTGIIRILRNTLPTFAVGDVVEVKGDIEFKQELTRFRSASEVKFLERKPDFAYPTPKTMNAAGFADYVKAPTVEYVKYEGRLTKSGNNYNIMIGDGTIQPGLTNTLYVSPDLIDKDVVVTGYLAGVSGSSTKYPNTFVTSVVAKDAADVVTPAGVLQYSDAGNYEAEGVVSAVYTRGFMLSDCSGSILVYKNTAPTEKVGQIVRVKGTTSLRNGVKQFGNKNLEVTVLDETTSDIPAKMVPQEMTAAEFDALAVTPRVVYATIEGQLEIKDSGNGFNYFNLSVEGATTTVSVSYVDESAFDMSLHGKNVKVTGFLLDYSKGRVAMMYSKVEEVTAANVLSRAITRASDVQPNASALYRYDGTAWTAYEVSDNIGISVLQPADYVSTGANYLSNADAVLPVYLKNTFPYAQSGDTKAVVYFGNKDLKVVADEYDFDGAAWVKKSVDKEKAEMAFLKTGGKWMEAKEYYSNDFAGELHNNAQIVNVKLDGMNYVWSAGAAYTRIKASGYYQRNRDTESWLITGLVDLTEAIAPQMVFMASADYLYGGKIENAVSVHISTNYVPAAADATDDEKVSSLLAATWSDPIQFAEWPTTTKMIEMRAPMTDYTGKKVYVAFRYASNSDPGFAPTLYMSNFVVKE